MESDKRRWNIHVFKLETIKSLLFLVFFFCDLSVKLCRIILKIIPMEVGTPTLYILLYLDGMKRSPIPTIRRILYKYVYNTTPSPSFTSI